MEKLIANMIRNIQITVKNIHIRYEDAVSLFHHSSQHKRRIITFCRLPVLHTPFHLASLWIVSLYRLATHLGRTLSFCGILGTNAMYVCL